MECVGGRRKFIDLAVCFLVDDNLFGLILGLLFGRGGKLVHVELPVYDAGQPYVAVHTIGRDSDARKILQGIEPHRLEELRGFDILLELILQMLLRMFLEEGALDDLFDIHDRHNGGIVGQVLIDLASPGRRRKRYEGANNEQILHAT